MERPQVAGRGDHDRGRGVGGGVLERQPRSGPRRPRRPGRRAPGPAPGRPSRRGCRGSSAAAYVWLLRPTQADCEGGDHRHHDDQRRSPGASPASSSRPRQRVVEVQYVVRILGPGRVVAVQRRVEEVGAASDRPPWVGVRRGQARRDLVGGGPGLVAQPAALDLANGERPERVDQGVGVAARRRARPPPAGELVGARPGRRSARRRRGPGCDGHDVRGSAGGRAPRPGPPRPAS